MKVTADDVERGARFKQLRERLGLTQPQIFPKDHTQVIGVEKGRNKLTGEFLLAYAAGLGLSPSDLVAFRDGALTVEEAVQRSSKSGLPRQTKQAGVSPAENDDFEALAAEFLAKVDDRYRSDARSVIATTEKDEKTRIYPLRMRWEAFMDLAFKGEQTSFTMFRALRRALTGDDERVQTHDEDAGPARRKPPRRGARPSA